MSETEILESREQDFYLIEDEPNKKFEVLAVHDLEDQPALERVSMNLGYDGYLYKMRRIVGFNEFAETWHCLKKENEPFIKANKVFR